MTLPLRGVVEAPPYLADPAPAPPVQHHTRISGGLTWTCTCGAIVSASRQACPWAES